MTSGWIIPLGAAAIRRFPSALRERTATTESPHVVKRARVVESCAPIFARIDKELEHPELAPLWAWLAQARSSGVDDMQRAIGATKPALDRLSIAGPVSRTLGAKAEISVACELYLRHRTR